jgi:hypothetical protein
MCQPLGNQAVLIREIYRCIQQCSFKFGPTQIRTTKFQHTTLISGADQNATCSSHTQPKKKHYLHIWRDSLHLYSLVLFNQLQEISSNICSLNQPKKFGQLSPLIYNVMNLFIWSKMRSSDPDCLDFFVVEHPKVIPNVCIET